MGPKNFRKSHLNSVCEKKFVPFKAATKLEGPKFFLGAPKMVSFSQLPAVKKTPFLVQLENFSALLIF